MKLKETFKYRSYWMGIAMLWIMLFHSQIWGGRVFSAIKNIGYGGVDIFIFASGIGNYYSYLRDTSPLHFINRRIKKLAPIYVPFIIIWQVVMIAFAKSSYQYVIGNLFAIQGFTSNGGEFNWYLTGIIICYLLTPYFASFVKENNNRKNVLLLLLFTVISIAFWNDSRLIISVIRLPIYILGMIFAKNDNTVLTKKFILIITAFFVLGALLLGIFFIYFKNYLWNYGLYWYPFILITPLLCVAVSYIIDFIEKRKKLLNVFNPVLSILLHCGRVSFEIYLLHIFAFESTAKIIIKCSLTHQNLIYVCVSIVVILCSIIYDTIINKCKKLYETHDIAK